MKVGEINGVAGGICAGCRFSRWKRLRAGERSRGKQRFCVCCQ